MEDQQCSGLKRQQYITKALVISFVWQAGIYHFSLSQNRGQEVIKVQFEGSLDMCIVSYL